MVPPPTPSLSLAQSSGHEASRPAKPASGADVARTEPVGPVSLTSNWWTVARAGPFRERR